MKHSTVQEALEQYKQRSFRRWLAITIFLLIAVTIFSLCAHIYYKSTYVFYKNQQDTLEHRHAALLKNWQEQQLHAKKLKILKLQYSYLQQSSSPKELFDVLIQALPEQTFLTELFFNFNGQHVIRGIAPHNREELTCFLSHVANQKKYVFQLIATTPCLTGHAFHIQASTHK